MDKLVSSWFDVKSLPKTYIIPPEKRPGKLNISITNPIPVLDLRAHDRTETIRLVLNASEEFGFFQVINHGVCKDLLDDTMNVIKEFHAMPAQDKAQECSRDPNKSCRFYTSTENYATEEVHYWREAMTHPCNSPDKYMQFWPRNPTRYREVIGRYSVELIKLSRVILEMICEGLKLSPGYFSGELSENPVMLSNHYPRCPEPSLTLGLPKHRDPSLITIVLQEDVQGLQVLKNDEWIGVYPIPHAFVVNIGHLLQIISNGKLKGAEHRVVTNASNARTTASIFIYPSDECMIEPAETLVNASSPPLYGAFCCKDFRFTYVSKSADPKAVQKIISPTFN